MRYPCNRLAKLLILIGILILLFLLLPENILPFCIAIGLIAAGICLIKH